MYNCQGFAILVAVYRVFVSLRRGGLDIISTWGHHHTGAYSDIRRGGQQVDSRGPGGGVKDYFHIKGLELQRTNQTQW